MIYSKKCLRMIVLFGLIFFCVLSLPQALKKTAREAQADAPEPAGFSISTMSDTARYRIKASESRFMVKVFAGGLLSVFAHDHNIAIRDFTGETQFTYDTVAPASLHMVIKTNSLAVTDKVSDDDRNKIEGTMRKEVLEIDKYPEIVFKSTGVTVTKTGEGQYQARIAGNMTLHGATRPVTINAKLEFGANILRAKGAFSLRQSDFGIKRVSVAGGTIKVKDEIKFSFEIVAGP